MSKRTERSVRRVKETLTIPSAARRRASLALASGDPSASLPLALPGNAAMRRQIESVGGILPGAGAGPPADGTGPYGTPGTLNMWGYITGEDYNPDLDGYPMFPKYDQMRRSSAQVSASLLQIKLPFKAARKVIKPASEDTEDVAIADFVTACLLGDRAMKRPFEQTLDHLMLRFDFGCSAEEIIWEIGEAGELRVNDLAPRLPRTLYRWVEWDNGPQQGELRYVQQFAPKNGAYGFFDIPADRLLLHAHRREGNNYYGISLLRAAYPNWFWVNQLYRIAAVREDRLGAGIFIARLTADYKANVAPLAKLEETLKGLRSHEQAYCIQPWGVEYDILVPKNGESMSNGSIQLIEHHNQMIAANVLQQFSTQGQQKHGSFGQAKVTHDVFMDALEGQGMEMGTEITDGLIRPLCDANFDMRGRSYPRFDFTDIASADVNAIAQNMASLVTAGAVTAEDDLENWLRDLHDAPALPEALRGRNRSKVASTVPPAGGAPHPTPIRSDAPAGPVAAAGRDAFHEHGRSFAREPTALERRVFDLHGVPARLDESQAVLVRELGRIRRAQLQTVAARIAQKDGRETTAFTDIRHAHIKMPQVGAIVKAIRSAQDRALAYGRETVRIELQKQGVRIPDEHALADNPTAAASKRTAKSTLVSSAQVTARRQSETWLGRAMDAGIRLRRVGAQGDDLAQRIVDDLDSEAESGAKRDAAAEIHEAFGLGRAQEATQLHEFIGTAIYSAILDAATCDPCADLDGEEFQIDSQEYFANLPPNASCAGGDSCRCVMIFVAADEVAAGASPDRLIELQQQMASLAASMASLSSAVQTIAAAPPPVLNVHVPPAPPTDIHVQPAGVTVLSEPLAPAAQPKPTRKTIRVTKRDAKGLMVEGEVTETPESDSGA